MNKKAQFIELRQLGSLPTSIDHVPRTTEKQHECIDHPEISLSYYFFQAGKPRHQRRQGFPIDTYVYRPQVKTYDKHAFTEIYAVEGVDYEIIGRLTKAEFEALT